MSQAATWDLVADAYEDEVVPVFRAFANDTLNLVPPGARALDVACGPGTVALLAAARGAHVDALDFSPRMIEQLRTRIGSAPVDARVGDGMALPYRDATFDAAYSQFGLIFFPDRQRGLRELWRVLKPNARAAIASWAPISENLVLSTVLGWLNELTAAASIPPAPPIPPPMNSHASCRDELASAGFTDVTVHDLRGSAEFADGPSMIASFTRSSPPIALLKQKLGPRFDAIGRELTARAAKHFAPGPVRMDMPAYLSIGTKTA
jgi:SAM-dependent methyltransferase